MANRWENSGNSVRLYFSGSKITADGEYSHEIKRWKKSYDQPRQHIKSRYITLLIKVCLVKAMVFPVVMYGYESWSIKKAECQRIDAFELLTLESPLDCKEIQPVHPKGDQSWVFFERTYVEAETLIFWPPDGKGWLFGKDSDAGKDWRQEEKDDRGWDGWMASLTPRTWVWVHSGSWWWTGKPDMLQSMVSQRVGHDWVTKLNW